MYAAASLVAEPGAHASEGHTVSEQPRVHYRSPFEGIAAPADYPDAPISIVCDRTTPAADLFGVMVAIGGDIPLHYHSMMEFQYVISGTGLGLDADGGEIPIAPGGTVLSPAGPAGAHGFRNTGALPLTLLCIYPSPGGATPDRSPFDAGVAAGDGPRSVYVGPSDMRPVSSSAGADRSRAGRIIDELVGGAELFGELLSIPDRCERHFHPVFELLWVTSGTGVLTASDGTQIDVGPGGLISCPAGEAGAHALRNTGSLPLQLLSVYPAAGGAFPGVQVGAAGLHTEPSTSQSRAMSMA
jgi:uncharacterized cupin superfamily protein